MTVLFALVLSSLSRIFATRNSAVNAENFAGTGTTRPTSLFLLPVTRAQSLFSAFASIKFSKKLPNIVRYLVLNKVFLNKRRPRIDAALE